MNRGHLLQEPSPNALLADVPTGGAPVRVSRRSATVVNSVKLRTLFRASLLLSFLALFVTPIGLCVEAPHIVQKDGRAALFVEGRPYLILGAQMNNSSEWPSTLPNVWSAITNIHANTLGAPVYWQQLEPRPGMFNFTNVDQLIREAREHHVHLILLWFGASKNGQLHYAPDWVKTDTAHYPRLMNGRGQLLDILDPNAPSNLEADKRAFTTLMHHLREIDGEAHTILMMQVENEAGSYYADRDYTARGNKLFSESVPASLVAALHKHPGSWHDVFGSVDNETFALWSEARYINTLAEAGKTEFNIPMFINIAAIIYPNGEAVHRMLDIWKIAAPSIDIIGTDLYDDFSPSYQEMLNAYGRRDNPLWVSETGSGNSYAKFFFYALGDGAIGFSPFGVDHSGWTIPKDQEPNAHAENYALIAPMSRDVALLNFEGRLKTAVEEPGRAEQEVDFGDWQATVTFGYPQPDRQRPPGTPDFHGRVLIARLGADEFLVTGIDARVTFHVPSRPPPSDHHINNILHAEQGTYVDGAWKPFRIWNGDETQRGLNFEHDGNVIHVTVYRWD